MKVTIYWERETKPIIRKRIREKFNIPDYLSINGETPCEIKDSDMELLKETARRGFIQIRSKSD
jgi:hypothetical protein